MPFAERYVLPTNAELGDRNVPRTNDFRELFYVRWGCIRFDVFWGAELNLKVVLKVYRFDDTCEHFIVDTDSYDVQWNFHKRGHQGFLYPSVREEAGVGEASRILVHCPFAGKVDSVLIRLSQTLATGSMLSLCVSRGRSWRWTWLHDVICRSRARCRSSSACSRTKPLARRTLSARDGVTGLSVCAAGRSGSPIGTLRVLVFFVAGRADTRLASPLAPSWSARTRRCPCGSGRPIWSPVRRGHIGCPAPTATRAVALRDGLPDPS